MIDIGANLSNSQFDNDLQNVLENSKQANIKEIILTATDLNTFLKNKDIIEKFSHIIPLYNTLGLHPHHADKHVNFFSKFDELIKDSSIVSLGEFGLDYFRMLSSKDNQIKTMEIFLEKAQSISLPLFLHERHAHQDFVDILRNNPIPNKKVVHCFTGNKNEVKTYLDMDCYIGITGWVTEEKRGKDLREALNYIPLDKLMIETDAPYLTPKNLKNKVYRNEPQFLPFVLKKIAEIKNVSLLTLQEQTYRNTVDFFQLNSYNKNITMKMV